MKSWSRTQGSVLKSLLGDLGCVVKLRVWVGGEVDGEQDGSGEGPAHGR